jgi:hypothetical protein
MISRNRVALFYCFILLFLSACRNVPPPPGETVPETPPDPPPVAEAEVEDVPEEAAEVEEESVGSLREALRKSSVILSGGLEPGASVAVVAVNADDSFQGEYAMEELALLLVRMRRFRVVDRKNIDVIRAERRFQISGGLDDETAVSIGRLVGAAFVITGGISPEPGLRLPAKRFRLRVLDVRTGQICALSSVAFWGEL